jgi:hypothetical protein
VPLESCVIEWEQQDKSDPSTTGASRLMYAVIGFCFAASAWTSLSYRESISEQQDTYMHFLKQQPGMVVPSAFRFRVNTLFGGLYGVLVAIPYVLRAIYVSKEVDQRIWHLFVVDRQRPEMDCYCHAHDSRRLGYGFRS